MKEIITGTLIYFGIGYLIDIELFIRIATFVPSWILLVGNLIANAYLLLFKPRPKPIAIEKKEVQSITDSNPVIDKVIANSITDFGIK